MKNRTKRVLCCTASVCAFTALFSATAMAADTDIDNSVWSYRATADVTTQVNIRAYASTDSSIIGYLPKGATADVVERGAEWTHVISNGVEGYIMNDYLVYGEEAKNLASVYGEQGVSTSWDGVNMFAEPNASADILATAGSNEEYTVVESSDLWYTVQLDDATIAYVPAEDVSQTVITERAIPVETTAYDSTYTEETADTSSEVTAYTDESYTDESYMDTTTEEYYAAPETETYTEETYTESYDYDATAEESYDEPTEAPESAEVSEVPQSEETVTSASADDLSLLAAIIYCEAGNQSREGKVAVGAVVLNRVASSSFPNTISEVIYQSGQFTPAYSGGLSSALANGVPSDCVEAAQAALNGENPVGGAMYFNTGSGSGMKIGAHQFY